jgi:hypothetical protein
MPLILNHATRKYRRLYFVMGCIFSCAALSIYALAWVPVTYGIENHIVALVLTTASNYFLFKACLELSSRWKTSVIGVTLVTNCIVMGHLLVAALEYL